MTIVWKKHHAGSGSTSFRAQVNGCELVAVPKRWTDPTGPSIWTATCGQPSSRNFQHKRGEAKKLAGAKQAAKRAAAVLKR